MSAVRRSKRRPRRTQRTWRAHVLAGLLVTLTLLGGHLMLSFATEPLYPACVADYSEDTIVAPRSYQGRLLCRVSANGNLTESELVRSGPYAVPVVLALAGLVSWVRARRLAALLPLLLASLVAPWLLRGTIDALPADCTVAQWDEHGPRGCERNEELRPGISQY